MKKEKPKKARKFRSHITNGSALVEKVGILTGIFLLSVLFAVSPWGRHLEFVCYDTLMSLRVDERFLEPIVVVAVDEPSFGELGQQWPWPRGVHAELLDTLFREGSKVVALDILFSEPADVENDQRLARSIRSHDGIVTAAAMDIIEAPGYRHQSAVYPSKTLVTEKTRMGMINLPLDSDGFVRRAYLTYGALPSLSMAAVDAFASVPDQASVIDPSGSGNEMMINFAGPPRTISTVSYYQALEPRRYLPEDFFRDKLVFVGLSLRTTPEVDTRGKDHFPYPYSRFGSDLISGVEIQATLAANLLTGNYIRSLPRQVWWTCLVWGIGLGMLMIPRPRTGLTATVCLTSVILFLIGWLFGRHHLYFPPLITLFPILCACLAVPIPHLLRLRREKALIRNTFSKYVSPKVVAQLIEHPELVRLGGNRVDATVLYLDIAGFSRMATKLSPEALSATLSRYLGHFTESIFNQDGMVDKYVGDAIMAVWGVPLPQPDHPARACRAALDIRRDLAFLLARETLPSNMGLDIRIGINSGAMLAGNVGGDRFLNYTVHGEATNFAVRLEALNKLYGTHILLGENTALHLGDEFLMRKIDCIRLDGNQRHTDIYELIGVALGGDEMIRRHIEEFEAARKMFLDRKFREARYAFTKILSDDDTDSVCRVYLERCREYEEEPPSPSWDCVADIHLK